MNLSFPLQLTPQYRDYLWGGQRLRPGRLTAEAWVIYAEDRVRRPHPPGAGVATPAVAAPQGVQLSGGSFNPGRIAFIFGV
jgi:hypothetical protein